MNSTVGATAGGGTGEAPAATPASPPPNPFVGPVPLDVGQQLHGRRRETEELSDLLVSKRVVVLFAPSGAGKTSLVRAGLIPKLKQAYAMEALPIVRLGHRDPECDSDASINRYRLAMLHALEQLRDEGARRSARDLRGYTLERYFEECVSGAIGRDFRGEPHYPLLVLDQFEELFTADSLDVKQKREFVEELGRLLRGGVPGRVDGEPSVPIWALFAIREDHLAELQPYLDLLPTALSFRYRLDALGVEAAREAIAETAGRDWMDADVPQRLVDDLCTVSVRGTDGRETFQPGRFVEPVQLQVVCRGLWEKIVVRQGRKIQAGDVQSQDQSEVDRALRDFFDEEVAAAAAGAGVSERGLREWIERQLISGSGVRIQTLRDTTLLGRTDEAIMRLVDAHLLRIDTRGGHDWVELPHDRLVAPIRAANKAWALGHLQPFQKQATYWHQAAGEHALRLLLAEDELAAAKAYACSHADDITQEETAFLDASQQEIVRKAEEVEKDRRERRRRMAMVGIFAIVVLAMLGAWAFIEHKQEDERRERSYVYSELGSAWGYGWTGGTLARMVHLRADATAADRGLASRIANNAALERLLRVPKAEPVLARFVDDAILKQLGRSPAALVRELQPRTHVVWSLAFTGDGNRLLAGSWDGHISVQDVAVSGADAFETGDLNTVTYAVAIDDAKGLVVSTHGDGSARLWRLEGRRLQLLKELVPSTDFAHRLTTADFSADGRWLAVAGWGKNVEVWDVADKANPLKAASFLISGSTIMSIAFLPGTDVAGRFRLATTDYDGVVRLWSIGEGVTIDPKKPQREFSIQDHERRKVGISASAADPSGRYFVAGDTEGNMHLWDLDSDGPTPDGILLGRATYGDGPDDMAVKSIAFAPRSNEFVSVGVDGYVVRWRLPDHHSDLENLRKYTTQQRFRIGDRERLYSVAYRPHRPVQIAVGATRKILLLDLDRGSGPALSVPLPGSSGQTAWQTVSMDANGTRIAARGKDGPIRVWLREHGRIRAMPAWTLAADASSAFSLSPDGRRLVTVDCHGTATDWSLQVGTRPKRVHAVAEAQGDCPARPVADPSFSQDGRFLATANDNILRVWQRGTSAAGAWSESFSSVPLRAEPPGSSAPARDHITILAFSADGHYLAAGAESGEVRLWHMVENPGAGPFAPVAHVDAGQRVDALTFNPDGTQLLVGGDDGFLSKCHVPDLKDCVLDSSHVRSVTGAAYAWDRGHGERPMHVTASADGYVVEWTMWNGNTKAIDLTERGSSPVSAIALSGDGRFLVTAGQDLLGWNLAPDDVLATAEAYAKRSYGSPKAQSGAGAK